MLGVSENSLFQILRSSSDSDETGSEDKAEKARKKSTARAGTSFATTSGTTGLDTAICQTCEGDANKNKDGQAEALIKCTKCSLASKQLYYSYSILNRILSPREVVFLKLYLQAIHPAWN